MYNLIEGSLWQYNKDEPNDNLTNFVSFKSKIKITGHNSNNRNAKYVEIIVP